MSEELLLQLSYLPSQLEVFFDEDQHWKYKVVPKGRRTGITQGASLALTEYCLMGISPILWVDSINGNIDRYYERYFLPVLKKLPDQVYWNWNQQKRELKIEDSVIDFRSADKPESLEGFGYKIIFLNEAGIILKDDYLYSHAIVPMLLDFPDSKLIAAGVPKGKHKKSGEKHKFFELYENALAKKPGYKLQQYSSFDNPLLNRDEIMAMINEMTDLEARQEIYGEFVEYAGQNPFCHKYDSKKHESVSAIFRFEKQVIISVDFNLNPFAVTFHHAWQDATGFHHHQFDEGEIMNGSIPAMIDLIKSKPCFRNIHSATLTGDAMGNKGDISQRDNATLYHQLLRGLGMSSAQLKVKNNPTHENSRADVNYFMMYFPDYKINPNTCPNTCRDAKTVQCDAYGQIIKKNRNDLNQRADYLDAGIRYIVHNIHKQWILNNQRIISLPA